MTFNLYIILSKVIPKKENSNFINDIADYFKSDEYDWDKVGFHWEILAFIVFIILSIFKLLQLFRKFKKKKDFIFQYYDKYVIDNIKKYYVKSNGQLFNPMNYSYNIDDKVQDKRFDLLKYFVKNIFNNSNVNSKYFFILGDTGYGKTTFLIKLILRYYSNVFNLFKNKNIIYFHLAEYNSLLIDKIKAIENKEELIILLDALDESFEFQDSDNFKKSFDELMELTKPFFKIIVTCRTQFISNEIYEPYELNIKNFNTSGNGYSKINKIYLSPFNKNDIQRYLNKKFNYFEFNKKRKAWGIIKRSNDLFIRPMILSNIDELIKNENNISDTISIYIEIINNWIKRESNVYPIDKKENFELNLYNFSIYLAAEIYKSYGENSNYISVYRAQEIAKLYNIELSLVQLKSKSLLNRTSDGWYKFSHKSILEYFLAIYCMISLKRNEHHLYKIPIALEHNDFAKKIFTESFLNQFIYLNTEKLFTNKEIYRAESFNIEKGDKVILIWLHKSFFPVYKIENIHQHIFSLIFKEIINFDKKYFIESVLFDNSRSKKVFISDYSILFHLDEVEIKLFNVKGLEINLIKLKYLIFIYIISKIEKLQPNNINEYDIIFSDKFYFNEINSITFNNQSENIIVKNDFYHSNIEKDVYSIKINFKHIVDNRISSFVLENYIINNMYALVLPFDISN